MTVNGWIQILVFLALIFAVTKPLGVFMARIFNRERTFLDPIARPLERLLYRVTGVDENHEMRWTEYAASMLMFSGVSMLLLYLIERVQQWLPWNPQKFGAVAQDLAFNTAASFTTNTNWQNYAGETTMSYPTQMAGLAYHNFASAAVGIALAIAFVRGIARREKVRRSGARRRRTTAGRSLAFPPLTERAAELPVHNLRFFAVARPPLRACNSISDRYLEACPPAT
jgi:K+-transporting ATPase ATPase A chain